ncbi:MAG: hypothetical protein KA066_02285 [Candidatus Pacebacteria bacterium]|nr:hypothetical protein [Candidatus Paceibacterota bacterium]
MVLVAVLAAAVAALFYFYSSGGDAPLLTSSEDAESPVSQELLATLGNLRTIRLDNSVFSDPLFMSLSDFGVTIPPAAAGRRNPFAPVGQNGPAAAPAATTTGTAAPAL